MAKRVKRSDEGERGTSGDDALREHASRSSALLASRAANRSSANGVPANRPSVNRPSANGTPANRPSGTRQQNAARSTATQAPQAAPSPTPRPRASETTSKPQGILGFIRRNIIYIACVAFVAALVAAALVAMRAVLPMANVPESVEEAVGYVSPYDWAKLDRTGGRYRYVIDGQVTSRLGVDVSENQHAIDWNAVAADGIDFAMIRLGYRGATEGDLYLDASFEGNLEGARAAGLDCGVYFFSQARTPEEAVEEADYVIAQLGGAPLEYPVAFDSEEVELHGETSRTNGLSNDEMTANCEAFCNRIEQAGYRSIVYGNRHDLSRYRYASLEQDDIWWAEYGANTPSANIDIAIWQYSNSGQVAGIPTAVDLNIDLSRALG